MTVGRPLAEGERVMLRDRKGRRHLITLQAGGEFHSHSGVVLHDELVGGPEGRVVRTSRGSAYTVLRPTLSDTVLKMPRGAQVIYPKDLGAILVMADIFPGARVLESGLGSGALSMTLLRAGAHICGVEIREDFARRAERNVEAALGHDVLERYEVAIGDAYQGIDATGLDRIVLDLPEPWQVLSHAPGSMVPGGLMVAYTPTITQALETRRAMDAGPWTDMKTIEVLHRGWHIEGQSVRPNHRMVGHTGFLTAGRLLAAEGTT